MKNTIIPPNCEPNVNPAVVTTNKCALNGLFWTSHDAAMDNANDANAHALQSSEPANASHLCVNHLNERLDVSEGEGEGLFAGVVAIDFRDVVGHQHAVVADFLIGADGADHIDVAVVGEGLAEV